MNTTKEKNISDTGPQYIPVGRVRRRRKPFKRAVRTLARLLLAVAQPVLAGLLAGAGFGAGLALITAL